MQERFVLLEGVPAGRLGAAQGCLQSAVGAWRPAPSVRGTAQRGMGTATPGCLSDPLCHRLLPLPRGTFSEINGHVESIFASTGFTRSRRSAPGRKNGGFAESSARERRWHMRSSSRSFAPVLPCHSRACRPQHATVATAPVTLQDERVGTCAPQPSASCGRLGSCHVPDGAHWLVACSVLFNLPVKLAKSRLHRSRGDAPGCSGYPPAR
jgi:hypothetical protein